MSDKERGIEVRQMSNKVSLPLQMKKFNPAAPHDSIALTDAEWSVIRVVWRLRRCTAGEVQAELAAERGWAYSTVKTTMDRMVKKDILSLERDGNVQWFAARLTQAQVSRTEVRRLLERAFDGAVAPMFNCLVQHEKLTAADIAVLRRLIDETDRGAARD